MKTLQQTDYKTVFQLAQDKGYPIYKHFYPAIMVLEDKPERDEHLQRTIYYELCAIQKWLRDEHKIIIELQFSPQNSMFYAKIYNTNRPFAYMMDMQTFSDGFVNGFNSCESALLSGIHEALKLI